MTPSPERGSRRLGGRSVSIVVVMFVLASGAAIGLTARTAHDDSFVRTDESWVSVPVDRQTEISTTPSAPDTGSPSTSPRRESGNGYSSPPPQHHSQRSGGPRQPARACEGTGPATITASPIALEDLAVIQPMGLAIYNHVTPIDHGYFYIKGSFDSPPKTAAVFAPVDGVVTAASRMARRGDADSSHQYDDYALTIDATCTFRVRFSNLLRFDGRLKAAVGDLAANEHTAPNVRVKAGEFLGYTGMPTAHGIDVWVEDDDSTLTGFIKPEQYEPWKPHMVDLFEHTREPLRTQLLGYVERDAEPRWGKIDWDIDGRLIGSWFLEGSGGYFGNRRGGEGYWEGHLSVVPHGNDPTQAIVSFGSYEGRPRQLGVLGNRPDPAEVSVSSGLVKYELGQIELYSEETGEVWSARGGYLPHLRARAVGPPSGTVLLQLTGTRTLKMQTFPGRTADEVPGFDAGALIYTR